MRRTGKRCSPKLRGVPLALVLPLPSQSPFFEVASRLHQLQLGLVESVVRVEIVDIAVEFGDTGGFLVLDRSGTGLHFGGGGFHVPASDLMGEFGDLASSRVLLDCTLQA